MLGVAQQENLNAKPETKAHMYLPVFTGKTRCVCQKEHGVWRNSTL
jgi:hypothetical protein